jgi:hypothetical protein
VPMTSPMTIDTAAVRPRPRTREVDDVVLDKGAQHNPAGALPRAYVLVLRPGHLLCIGFVPGRSERRDDG